MRSKPKRLDLGNPSCSHCQFHFHLCLRGKHFSHQSSLQQAMAKNSTQKKSQQTLFDIICLHMSIDEHTPSLGHCPSRHRFCCFIGQPFRFRLTLGHHKGAKIQEVFLPQESKHVLDKVDENISKPSFKAQTKGFDP